MNAWSSRVIGEAANWTARYCAGAGSGEILISPALHQRMWRYIDAELITIDTKHEGSLSAYRLKGIKSAARGVNSCPQAEYSTTTTLILSWAP